MKLYNRIIVILGLTGIILSGCSESEEPSAKENQLNNLSGTWEISSVSVGGDNVTSDYSSFEVTLSGSASADVFAYGVTGRPDLSPWPAGGTWSFGSDLNSDMVRDPGTPDELVMDYSVSGSQLTIEFTFVGTGYSAARVNSMEGNWTYTFTKK